MRKLLCRLFGHRSMLLPIERSAGLPDHVHLCERCGMAWQVRTVPQDRRVVLEAWSRLEDLR